MPLLGFIYFWGQLIHLQKSFFDLQKKRAFNVIYCLTTSGLKCLFKFQKIKFNFFYFIFLIKKDTQTNSIIIQIKKTGILNKIKLK